jgi:hypothetical protein
MILTTAISVLAQKICQRCIDAAPRAMQSARFGFFFLSEATSWGGTLHKDIHSRALKQAAKILGGDDALRQHLGASEGDFTAWSSTTEMPRSVFLRVVDIITREEPRSRKR